MKNLLPLVLIAVLFHACQSDVNNAPVTNKSFNDKGLFSLLSNEATNITFKNNINETLELNTVTNDAIIQGAGVGILDVNNDGLPDIFFSGNMVDDQLYLNEGNFRFKNISESAGISGDQTWSTGAAIVDINNDGYDDIYVCKFIFNDKKRRTNKLYINNKDNTFTESAKSFGLADDGYSVMANFFDYDLDGDLDAYIANQPPSEKKLRKNLKQTDYQFTDRLYRNEGNNKFTDVTLEAGVRGVNFSLSATVSDFNADGLPDLYVASDYEEPDILYQNNGDGTFKNITDEALKHMSNFSMGADIADINNDGHMDIFTADMVAEDNFRNKTNMSSMAVEKFWGLVEMGFHYQFMFNSLQLNNGNGTFSEIAQMSGISKTDWSWSSLFVDADQDGYKDLFVTNGILKEIRNKDYSNNMKKMVKDRQTKLGKNTKFDPLELSAMAPSKKIKNRAFKNSGDLVFDKKTDAWGFGKPGWSQGMAYADFDNDGDLDFVISNTNEIADIYKNEVNERKGNNYLSISAKGMPKNGKAINAQAKITYGDGLIQVMDFTPFRGYMSSSQILAHFGVGGHQKVNEVQVIFPDGKVWSNKDVATNQSLEVVYTENLPNYNYDLKSSTLFNSFENAQAINYEENRFDDYQREVLIPYKMSNLGPTMAVGDVNNDGLDDLYIGGAVGFAGKLYLQNSNGQFEKTDQPYFDADNPYEDGDAKFFDVDLDGDLDLFVTSGGNEYPEGTDGYQDRLYINTDGKNYLKTSAVPVIGLSTGSITTLDYDNDGDLDLFVAGRQVPGKYGRRTNSLLLENTRQSLLDVTAEKASVFNDLGMVTGGAWEDIDGDGQKELILSGEWIPITVLKWNEGKFIKAENPTLANSNGLWNTVQVKDIDSDGDMDIIAGNYGLNYKYTASEEAPFKLFVNDFDKNGTNDVYLGYQDESDGNLYPVRGRQCSSEQMPFVADKFANYNAFGNATVDDVLEGKLEGSTIEECYTFAHKVFINNGSGNFNSTDLPMRAQASPIYDMEIRDFNNDSHLDIFCVGNFHQREVETTRSDAGVGTLMFGDGKGKFEIVAPDQTGVIADKDARAMGILNGPNKKRTLVSHSPSF